MKLMKPKTLRNNVIPLHCAVVTLFLCIGIFFVPVLVSAAPIQQVPLEVGIGSDKKVTDLTDYIGKLYKFTVGAIGIISAVMIMVNGLRWAAASGNSEQIGTAKEGITSAIIGLIIALSSYLILNTLNPTLTALSLSPFPSPTTQNSSSSSGSSGSSGSSSNGSSGTKTENCTPVTTSGSACTVSSLKAMSNPCFNGNEEKASSICNIESRGIATIGSGSDRCQPGKEIVSWGLFQINLSAHKIDGLDCPTAFDKMFTGNDTSKGQNPYCKVVNKELYDKCVAAAKNAEKNIKKACEISKNGTKWGAWGANSQCHF